MPRAFTAAEQERVRARLLAEGAARFAAHGLARVSVAELAAAAGIAKGSFYLFFPSKEALLFEVHARVSERARVAMLDAIAPLERAGDGVAALAAFLRAAAGVLRDHPLLRRLAEPETLAQLVRLIPDDEQRLHRDADRAWHRDLQARWTAAGLLDPAAPADLVHHLAAGVFALALADGVLQDGAPVVLETYAEGAGARWGRMRR